jgi:O-antigen ligase
MFQRLSLASSQPFASVGRLGRKVEWPVAVIATLGIGIVLGQAMTSPARETVVALVVMLVFSVLLIADPKSGLLTWLVLYPFLGEAIHLDLGAGLPDLSLTRFCVGLLTVIMLAQIATHQRPMLKINRIDVAAFGFFVALSASTLVAVDLIRALQHALDQYFLPLLVYFVARNLIDSRKDLDRLLSALLIMGFYSGIYIIYEHTTGNILFINKDSGELSTTYDSGIRIVRGLLGGPHVFGLVFTMALPFAIQRCLESRQRARRMMYLALSGLFLVGLFLTYKRGAWLAAAASFLVMQFLYPRFRRFSLALLIAASVLLVFTGDQLGESEAAERWNDRLDTANGRTYRWEAAIELWRERPLFGYGFGQYDNLSEYNAAENFYLNILVSAGVVGLLPFLALLIFVGQYGAAIYRQSKRESSPTLFVGWETIGALGGSITSYLVKAFSGNMSAPLPNILAFLLIGAIVGSQVSRLLKGWPNATDN